MVSGVHVCNGSVMYGSSIRLMVVFTVQECVYLSKCRSIVFHLFQLLKSVPCQCCHRGPMIVGPPGFGTLDCRILLESCDVL